MKVTRMKLSFARKAIILTILCSASNLALTFQQPATNQTIFEKRIYTTKPYGLGYSLKKAKSWEELQLLLKQFPKVILYVATKWCHYCWKMTPRVKKVADAQTTDVVIIKVDSDEVPEVKKFYGVMRYPTFLFISHETVLDFHLGTLKTKELLAKVNQFAQS